MCRFLIAVVVAVFFVAVPNTEAIGLPPMPMMPMCCCQPPPPCPPPPPPCPPPQPCGCGGRKKREAIEPVLKTESDSCPQPKWKPVIEANIGLDAAESARAVHDALYKKFDEEFFVSCQPTAQAQRFVAHGDGYCVTQTADLTCQVVALVA